jgi:hypothetical protein
MKCSDIGEVELWGGKYRNYLCSGTTSFFRKLVLFVLHSEYVDYKNGVLIIDFHTIEPYIYDEKTITYKKLNEMLKRAKSDRTEVVRYAFFLSPLIQVLTPESDVFRKVFRVEETGMLSWIVMGKQAVKYVDSIIAAFGLEKAAQTLTYFFECVTKKYLEEFERK